MEKSQCSINKWNLVPCKIIRLYY
uniref:Uncharacterized protein n=1 Tax=Arundo donax TaxID=35708 RepID=A0A0A9AX62_ARUDO